MSSRAKSPATAECTCARLEVDDERVGYGEGCAHVERLCRGCDQWREQVSWGWGTIGYSGLVRWVCSTCRFPAAPPVEREWPDFTASLAPLEDEIRHATATALSTAASRVGPSDTADVLHEMAKMLRAGTELDVDLSGVDLEGRRRIEASLHSAAYASSTPQSASGVLARLSRVFGDWVDAQLPAEVPPLSWHERKAAERAAMRASRERRVTDR